MRRILTGIKPTGIPHLGNYVGAIRPAIDMANRPDTQAFLFIADYHALNQIKDPKLLGQYSDAVAASFLAAGLNTNSSCLYRQSDVPEIFELATILSAFTPKGYMNTAHAYKAAKDQNRKAGYDADAGINMGLYSYPLLMAADILLFDPDTVPVGNDQIQHIQLARDIAQKFNLAFDEEIFRLPEYEVVRSEDIPGIDGRKMSKSYENTIPLFASSADYKKAVYSILTDSARPEDKKVVAGMPIFEIYSAIASEDDTKVFGELLANGEIGYAQAKAEVLDALENSLMEHPMEEMTEVYNSFLNNKEGLESILESGAARAREAAAPVMSRVKQAIRS